MHVIGLTGGIGAGKSTVAASFSALGVPVIDSDQLAREAVLPGTSALQQIVDQFGPGILLKNGLLNREKLRQEIFKQKSSRLWVENLLHPIIRQLMATELNKLSAPYCMVQIPLLAGRHPNPLIQRVLLVDAEQTNQLQRVQQRDQLDQETIQSIIDVQPDRQALLAAADDIIKNNGSLQDLQKQVLALHQHYLKL